MNLPKATEVTVLNKPESNTELYCDVAVIGAGPSGIAAAIRARSLGGSVLLIEREGSVGGMSTTGLLNVWCGDCDSAFYRQIRSRVTCRRGRRDVFSPEQLKSLYLDELERAGVELLLHTTVIDVNIDDRKIENATLFCCSERITLKAKIFIDATGNGDLARLCGLPYEKGRPSDGLMQPITVEFSLGGGVDSKAVYPTFGRNNDLQAKMREYVDAGRILPPAGHIILIEGIEPSTAHANMTNAIMLDGTDPFEYTKAEILCRKQIPQIIEFLRECVPGYEHCFLMATASYAGIRESRRFVGRYQLTEYDILAERVFDDYVVRGAMYCFGNHNLTGSGSDPHNLKYNGQRYTIPYSSLLPKDLDNLLFCGRNISGTHMAHGSYRVMPICMGIGEGAGTAAAICAADNLTAPEVDTGRVRAILGI